MLDRSKQLVAQGFQLVVRESVALPHQVWRVDLEIEEEQELDLFTETILRLVAANVSDVHMIARLMGVSSDLGVERCISVALQKGQLRFDRGLIITKAGEQALASQMRVVSKVYKRVEVCFDPYEDIFRWDFGESTRARADPLRALPEVGALSALDVQVRHAEIGELIERFGLPFDRARQKGERERVRDLIRVTPQHHETRWREATLEVYHHPVDQLWDWRLLLEGGELTHVQEKLLQAQERGQLQVLPLEPAPAASRQTQKAAILDKLTVELTADKTVLATDDHRPALRDAIASAQKELLIVSPWLTTSAVNDELLGWLEQALKRRRELQVVVGYGIEPAPRHVRNGKEQDQRSAIERLARLGRKYQGRLVVREIGNTHQKLVIVDGRTAITTSFNWLSFNPQPGRGIRLETGARLTDLAAVTELRSQVAAVLELD